jgi:hypothetical protein
VPMKRSITRAIACKLKAAFMFIFPAF